MRTSNYAILNESTRDILVIRDMGPWSVFKSVTNDAENVVETLFEEGYLDNSRRLWYYDSDGNLDELVHEDGKFKGFAPVRK